MKIEVALAGVQYLYFDSAPFIYFIESYPAYIKNMQVVMGKIARGKYHRRYIYYYFNRNSNKTY